MSAADELDLVFVDKDKSEPTELIILQHGLHGTEQDFRHFLPVLLDECAALKSALILKARANRGYIDTMKGVDFCAERLMEEIRTVRSAFPSLQRYSVVGHSFGGLIVRDMVERMTREAVPLEPVDFVTISSPWIGVRRPPESLLNHAFHFFATRVAGKTGVELLLEDGQDGRTPKLVSMAMGKHLMALAQFKRRMVYGNIYYDLQVPYVTSLFSLFKNPFRNGNAVDIVYKEGFDLIVDMDQSTFVKPPESPEFAVSFSTDSQRIVLRDMLKNLNTLECNKYPIMIHSWIGSHNQIIHNAWFQSGESIARHVGRRLREGFV